MLPRPGKVGMTLVPEALIIVLVALTAAALALAAFFWALRSHQFSVTQLREGANGIFEPGEEDEEKRPADFAFRKTRKEVDGHHPRT